ncbi:tetratricopeptide repeat protein [Actinomadura darangshiensis]|uniref:Tetratricopeptide repeat protein n=1 Tax=Actinomadura darangshiensis TaxID=705336 RepID=A0A4R5ARN3_9ACTN|nr:helix-turn-helix domain-containing/SEL1-like repeat protein [Actinomadura darangshiensis]TDD75373.1 tetratricopeptide repeat protein [Actinomadura darangshiensis]
MKPDDESAAALDDLKRRLRQSRHEQGLTMSVLASRAQLGRTTISQALSGDSKKVPSEATVIRLAKALRVAPEPLLALRNQADPAAGIRGTAAPIPPQVQRVGEADLTELGVHPALGLADARPTDEGGRHAWYPPYVPRDRDGLIDSALARGGLVIVEGRSGAGKSRSAAEAIRRVAADRQLLIPADRDELAALSETPGGLREAVVWLDNLECFGGPGGFDLRMLTRLCPRGRQDMVVLATLRSEERQRLEQRPGLGEAASAADALRVAAVIRLELRFSPVERERAAGLRDDPRIAGWLDSGDATGLAEHLAAGPPAVARWLAGRGGRHLLGAALVSAAVDCRRLHYNSKPLSLDLLTELARFYLDPADAHRPDRPTIEEALTWATEPVSGASSCLLPRTDNGYWAFDYLVDHAQHDPDAPAIPEQVLSTLLSRLPDRDARAVIGQVVAGVLDTDKPRLADLALDRFGRIVGFDRAWELVGGVLSGSSSSHRGEDWTFTTRYLRWLRPFAEEGGPVAMRLTGITLCADGSLDQGEVWLRRAAEAGDDDAFQEMASLLLDAGRDDELESWIDNAVTGGRGRGVVEFAIRLLAEDKRVEAEHWCRWAANLGGTDAMVALGELCWEDGKWAEAERLFTDAAEAGHPIGMFNLALVLKPERGRRSEADAWLRKSAEARYGRAVLNYAMLLDQYGDEAGLAQWLERERAAGDSEQVFAFARQLASRGNVPGAEPWFRHAMEMGNVTAIRALGDVKRSQGKLREAAEYYRQAIDAGDILGMQQLANIHIKQHEPEKAEQILREMLEELFDFRDRSETEEEALGQAAHHLGLLLQNRGATEEAQDYYKIAATLGNTDAANKLARLQRTPKPEGESPHQDSTS